MTYQTHQFGITSTTKHQLFEFIRMPSGETIGKVVYEWGRRPVRDLQLVDSPDLDYVVHQIRSE